jgi:hypothetical protein
MSGGAQGVARARERETRIVDSPRARTRRVWGRLQHLLRPLQADHVDRLAEEGALPPLRISTYLRLCRCSPLRLAVERVDERLHLLVDPRRNRAVRELH